MIDTKKLMIGNYVDYAGIIYKVESMVYIDTSGYYLFDLNTGNNVIATNQRIENIEPIPLTEEWLDKFNLPKRDESGPEYSIRNDFEVYCYLDSAGYCLFYGEISTELNEFFIIKCDSVHTFQNIYAILNPLEELTIKA